MKTQTKKILLGLGIALMGSFAVKAQGLQGFIVEKYYQVNAADVANAAANGGTLAPGSIVYRVFADLAPGYRFNTAFSDATHPFEVTTTTTFFNDPVISSVTGAQATSTTSLRQNTRMIDSWFTIGGAAVGKAGVLKTEDTDGSIGNAQSILANTNPTLIGVPITGVGSQDGLAVGASSNIVAPTVLGLSGADLAAVDFNFAPTGVFSTTVGLISALGGVVGTTTNNNVFLGQFTTDGVLGFKWNVQVQNISTGIAEDWFASNAPFGPTNFTLAALTLAPPTVTVTSPLNGANVITGTNMTITAGAAATGTVTQVQFFVNGTSIGVDNSAPFTAPYTAVAGSQTITATATDNNSLTATSAPVVISVANNQAPIVSVASPTSGLLGSTVTFTANAVDLDGTVASVSFSVDNIAIGTTTVGGPNYTFTWTVAGVGVHNVRASAADNLGLVGTSSPVNITAIANILPSVVINTPLNNSSIVAPNVVTITATASDADGSIALVEAFVNNVSIGTSTATGPNYTFTYPSSTLTTVDVIRVVATDNTAGTATSVPVSINIINSSALPYVVGNIKEECDLGVGFQLPLSTLLSYTVDDVIGYDVELYYDPIKVTPTGSVTVDPTLINPTWVTVANSFGGGTMNISAYFNASAPVNAKFSGTGKLFDVQFNKLLMTSIDTALYSVNYINESYFTGVTTKTASAGRYTTYRDTIFDFDLKFAGTQTVLPYNSGNVNQYLRTDVIGTNSVCAVNTNTATYVQPDLLGHVSYNILNGSSIKIQRDIAPGTSVFSTINANDVFTSRGFLLPALAPTFTPSIYQAIAADVNRDGQISSGDLSQIQQRTIGNYNEFRQAWNYNTNGTPNGAGASLDWVFVDSTTIVNDAAYQRSTAYPLASGLGFWRGLVPQTPFCLTVPQTSLAACPSILDAVYRGIMVGDVDGTFNVNQGLLRPNGSKKVIIDLANAVTNGNTVDVPVSFISTSPVVALDFELKFDESNLTFNSMVNFPSVADNAFLVHPSDRTLRFTTTNFDMSAYAVNRSVASIRFETTNGTIQAEQLNAVSGILNGELVATEVTNKTVGINSASSANSAVNVYPNPSTGVLNISAVGNATVEMFDVTGKEILLQTSVNANKIQQVDLSGFVNGVYILKVYNNDFISIKKIVLNK